MDPFILAGLGANHTSNRLPVTLVYAERFDRVSDAFYREKQVQGWSRSKKLALIQNDSNHLHILAECQNESHHARNTADGSPTKNARAERSRSPD